MGDLEKREPGSAGSESGALAGNRRNKRRGVLNNYPTILGSAGRFVARAERRKLSGDSLADQPRNEATTSGNNGFKSELLFVKVDSREVQRSNGTPAKGHN